MFNMDYHIKIAKAKEISFWQTLEGNVGLTPLFSIDGDQIITERYPYTLWEKRSLMRPEHVERLLFILQELEDEYNIIHHDPNLRNFVVTANLEEIRIIDFGLSYYKDQLPSHIPPRQDYCLLLGRITNTYDQIPKETKNWCRRYLFDLV